MAHAEPMLYNALQVMLNDPAIVAHLDPKALAQAQEAVRTFDEEHPSVLDEEEGIVTHPLCFVCMTWDGTNREAGHEGRHGAQAAPEVTLCVECHKAIAGDVLTCPFCSADQSYP